MVDFQKLQNKKDEDVISCVLKSPDCYSIIISRYERKLKNYILRISNISPDEADDILQDIFIVVYQNLNSFNQELSFSSWIYRIAHNNVINHWKKNKKNQTLSIEQNKFFIETIFNENSVKIEIENNLIQEEIQMAFNALDEKYKEVLILKFWEGKDYKEISDILQKPMGSIATLINRGKKNFIKKYNEIRT